MKIKREVEVVITVEELASFFAHLDDKEQAEFFNIVGQEDYWPWQLQYIVDSENLNNDGRTMMRLIGEYAEQRN